MGLGLAWSGMCNRGVGRPMIWSCYGSCCSKDFLSKHWKLDDPGSPVNALLQPKNLRVCYSEQIPNLAVTPTS